MRTFILIALGTTSTAFVNGAEEPVQASVWHRDLNKASKLARESGRPMFVVFRCER